MTANVRRWSAAALFGLGALAYSFGSYNEAAAQQPGNVVPATAKSSDYSQRVVAYIHGNVPITREDFGEYLIVRYGPSRVETLVNRKIIEHACKEQNIVVTAEEVEAKLAEDLATMTLDRATFVKEILKKYKKTLFEWKEDSIKVDLMLMKLARTRITVDDSDIQRAFDARYGEKVKPRIIAWPKGKEQEALATYNKIHTDEAAFDEAARHQLDPVLGSHAGFIDPIGRGESDILEKMAFKLKPGEVSELFEMPELGIVVMRSEGRIPADPVKKLETERESLRKIVLDQKATRLIPDIIKRMREEANPQFVLKYGTSDLDVIRVVEEEARILKPALTGPMPNGTEIPAVAGPSDNATRVVAYIYGNIPITREDLGTFLIDRYGQKKLEIMVNRKIIEYTCRQHDITVTPEEVQADIADTLMQMGCDKATFIKKSLKEMNLTLIEWQEDVVKPRIMLSKMCQNQVHVDDADIQRAFEMLYGEAVKTRLILWPKGTERQAYKLYGEIRSSEAAFDYAARHQASPKLSGCGGFLDPIRHGHDDIIEKIAFKLKPGEVSELFDIPDQGIAVLRCEGRLPADPTKKLETEKESLRKMAFDQKMAKLMPQVVNKMRADANPKFELRYGTNDQDVIRAAEEELKMSLQPQTTGASQVVPLPK